MTTKARACKQSECNPSCKPQGLQLEVRDNGLGSATNDGLGHGLVGIRERVRSRWRE
jgi:glucose-6-phosphate-specific signal transduction histidine kinase